MVNEVKVKATYSDDSKVPRIGQRKRMLVNGRIETLTLNRIEAERRHFYDDDGGHGGYEYDATETWSGYKDCTGW